MHGLWETWEVLELKIFFIQAWKVMMCGSWEAMENKVIWAVCICKLREQGKAAHNQETFPRKMVKFRLRKNVEDHDRGPGKVMEFSKLYS